MDRRLQSWVVYSAAWWAAAVASIPAAGASPPLRLAASGVLQRQEDSRGVRYILKGAEGTAIYEVSPTSRVDLARFAGHQVEVVGSLQGHRQSIREILAERVERTDRVVPAHFVEVVEQHPVTERDSRDAPRPAREPVSEPSAAAGPDPIPRNSPPLLPPPDFPDFPDRLPPLDGPVRGGRPPIFEGPGNPAPSEAVAPNLRRGPRMPAIEALSNPRSRGAECGPPHRIWAHTEYLYWWTKGSRLPPLLTTSPPGTPLEDAGVLGLPTTDVLFGDSRMFEDHRNGWRWVYGIWLGTRRRVGLQVDAVVLSDERVLFRAASDGSDILARPWINADPNQGPDVALTAFPGEAAGSLDIEGWNRFRSLGVQLRGNVLCNAGSDALPSCLIRGAEYRVDVLGGYRYIELDDRLSIREVTAVSIAPQLGLDVLDQFDADNRFHGGELGLLAQWQRGCLSIDSVVKLALGRTRQRVAIDGLTQFSSEGVVTPVEGGLLAQTNIGRYRRSRTDLIPEFGVSAGYLVASNVRVHGGYRIIYWPRVVRAGEQIDLAVGPQFAFRETSFWAHGLSAGIDYRW